MFCLLGIKVGIQIPCNQLFAKIVPVVIIFATKPVINFVTHIFDGLDVDFGQVQGDIDILILAFPHCPDGEGKVIVFHIWHPDGDQTTLVAFAGESETVGFLVEGVVLELNPIQFVGFQNVLDCTQERILDDAVSFLVIVFGHSVCVFVVPVDNQEACQMTRFQTVLLVYFFVQVSLEKPFNVLPVTNRKGPAILVLRPGLQHDHSMTVVLEDVDDVPEVSVVPVEFRTHFDFWLPLSCHNSITFLYQTDVLLDKLSQHFFNAP